MNKKDLTKQAKSLKPFTQIGSRGVSDGAVEKIVLYLKKHKLGKIKILDGALDNHTKQEVVEQVVKKTKATLIDQVGKVVVLWKR